MHNGGIIMKKTFQIKLNGSECEFTFTEITAINPYSHEREKGLHIHETKDEFHDGDGIVFDVPFPEDEKDVINILENDATNMITDGFVLETVKIILSDKQFNIILKAALANDTTEKQAFINKWSHDAIFASDETEKYYIEQEIAKIWDTAHICVKEIRAKTGLSQAKFAEKFCIPKRTIENWESGVNEIPDYTRLMLAEVTGAYSKGTEQE